LLNVTLISVTEESTAVSPACGKVCTKTGGMDSTDIMILFYFYRLPMFGHYN
jgi:hypothetical protein